MAHDSEGNIFIDPTTSPIQGVSTEDVGLVLGRSTRDIGLLCSDQEWNGSSLQSAGATNKFSKFKPFRNSAIGFAMDRTQATPELRSPARLAQLLAANFGLVVPKYGASAFKLNYAAKWTYAAPRGKKNTTLNPTSTDEPFRILDFDGYLHDRYWQVGPVGTHGLYTIFNGYFGVPAATVFAGDTIQFSIQCADDPDASLPGLLYPYSFLREQASDDDLSKYYMGIALIDYNGSLWVITGDRMDSHHTLYDVDASMSAALPNTVANGALIALPILASSQYPTWDNAPGLGYFISLDGAYLSLTKSSTARALQINVDVEFVNSGVTISLSLINQTANAITLSNLYGFYMSMASESNEPDTGYPAPAYQDPGSAGFIDENWPSASLDPVPSFPLNDGPNVYVDDWASGQGHYLAARAYTACFADFKSANNNSATIASGATVSWTKRFNNVTEDDFGSYAEYMRFMLCVRIGTTAYTQIFIADE